MAELMRRVCYRLRGRSPFPARSNGKKGDAARGVERRKRACREIRRGSETIGKSVNGIGITGPLPAIIRIHSGINTITGCRRLCGLQLVPGLFRFATMWKNHTRATCYFSLSLFSPIPRSSTLRHLFLVSSRRQSEKQ